MEITRRASNPLKTLLPDNDSSDDDECILDDSILQTLNQKLCTYEQGNRSVIFLQLN